MEDPRGKLAGGNRRAGKSQQNVRIAVVPLAELTLELA
jgi:hypothetical protein